MADNTTNSSIVSTYNGNISETEALSRAMQESMSTLTIATAADSKESTIANNSQEINRVNSRRETVAKVQSFLANAKYHISTTGIKVAWAKFKFMNKTPDSLDILNTVEVCLMDNLRRTASIVVEISVDASVVTTHVNQ